MLINLFICSLAPYAPQFIQSPHSTSFTPSMLSRASQIAVPKSGRSKHSPPTLLGRVVFLTFFNYPHIRLRVVFSPGLSKMWLIDSTNHPGYRRYNLSPGRSVPEPGSHRSERATRSGSQGSRSERHVSQETKGLHAE